MSDSELLYSKIILEEDFFQVRLSVNLFRDIEYIHIRKYYLDFDEEWKPSNEGISMPLSVSNIRNLFEAIIDILADAESDAIIKEHFKELLN